MSRSQGDVPVRLGRARLTVSCGTLARPVVGRFVAALGAETALAVDRGQEAVLVAEALADHCSELTPEGEMTVSADVRTDALVVRIGPLERGEAARLLAADAAATGAVRALGTRIEIRSLRSGRETLVVVIGPHPGDGTTTLSGDEASG